LRRGPQSEGGIKVRFVNLFSKLATTSLLLAASVGATPITFVLTIPNATGVNNLVPFTNQTLVITVQADTTQIIPVANYLGNIGLPGNCVPAMSTSISVGGGASLQAVAPMYFCADLLTSFVGIFTNPTAPALSWYFLADYRGAGITNYGLASNFPLTANFPTHTSITFIPLNLSGGGTSSITGVPAVGTTFAATILTAGIPTLSDIGLAALAALLVLAGTMTLANASRRKTAPMPWNHSA
jgi:hypothetical protein